jgi:nucleotide-binding universal stress UspA family protein
LHNVGESVSKGGYEESGRRSIYAQPPRATQRVLAVFEPGHAGEAALREAAELAEAGSELSVVTLAPQARPSRCCGKGGTGPYNIAVREEAEVELRQAREILGATARRVSFTVLVGHPTPPLAAWAEENAVDLILLPSHPFTRGGNRYARAMRRATSAEVRLVV